MDDIEKSALAYAEKKVADRRNDPDWQKLMELEEAAYCPHGFLAGCPACISTPPNAQDR